MNTPRATAMILSIAVGSAIAVHGGDNTWTAVGPPDAQRYYAFVIDPADSHTLYVATYGYPGLWRSRNGGAGWDLLGSGTPLETAGLLTDLAIDPHNSRHIVAISEAYFLASFDGGESWTSNRFPNDSYGAETLSASSDFSVLYIGSVQNCIGLFGSGCVGGGVSRSTDGGRTWNRTALKETSIGILEVDPVDSRIAYATAIDYEKVKQGAAGDLFRTRDGGRNWSRIGPAVTVRTNGASHLLIDPVAPSILFLSCESGLWTSADGGERWVNSQSGTPFTQIAAFATDPTSPGVTFAVTPGSQKLKTTCPQEPPPVPPGGPPLPPTLPVPGPPPEPCVPREIPVPTDKLVGVLRSSDHGQTWTRFIDPALPPHSFRTDEVAFDFVVSLGRVAFYQVRSDGLFAYTIVLARRRSATH